MCTREANPDRCNNINECEQSDDEDLGPVIIHNNMLFSRGLPALKLIGKFSNTRIQHEQFRRGHVWNYRTGPTPSSKKILLLADIVGGIAWWWVLWHLFTEYEEIIGEYAYPIPSQWTDEELGIPQNKLPEKKAAKGKPC
ncbi:hypothetical protein NQ317_007763 [Molorchus minor]|uniref:NADH dehydrogenase [ubiquinone] 1 beta subcomplex subunit 2, mitochondrial n=1 Tax=Molorchus minor TaxID=1323400 RepID=A0ABQ9IV10_9CUCU|nr:hypothetical protein NQ317_007763 [Molorchus minor]